MLTTNTFKAAFLALMLQGSMTFGQNLSNGLVANFHFDNGVTDNSASNITATSTNITFVDDRNAVAMGAAKFSQGNSQVVFNDAAIKVDLPLTVSFWLRLTTFDQPINTIFFSDNQFNRYAGYWIGIDQAGLLSFSFGADQGDGQDGMYRRSGTANQPLSLGLWYHVVGIIRGAEDITIYVDCSQPPMIYSGSGPSYIAYSAESSSIGRTAGNNGFQAYSMDAEIDDLAIWNRELMQSEIEILCNAEVHLGIAALSDNIEAGLYPNPTADQFTVTVKEYGEYNIAVYDTKGSRVLERAPESGDSFTVSLADLAPQAYYVEVTGNGKVTRLKVVRQ